MNQKLSDDTKVFFPEEPSTAAYVVFCDRALKIFSLFNYILLKTKWLEDASVKAANFLQELKNPPDTEVTKITEVGHTKELRIHLPQLESQTFISIIDAFETFVSDLSREIYATRPEMLSASRENMTAREILQFNNMDDLVLAIVDKKVRAQSFESFRTRFERWKDEHGMVFIENASHFDQIEKLIAVRNCLVHNKGLIDRKSSKLFGDESVAGKTIDTQGTWIFDAIALIEMEAKLINQRAVQKFNMEHRPSVDASTFSVKTRVRELVNLDRFL